MVTPEELLSRAPRSVRTRSGLEVDLAGPHLFEYPAAFPRGAPVAGDRAGNFWVADAHPRTGAWGPVVYACHDPPVFALQAPSLEAFLDQLLAPGAPAIERVAEEDATRIWNEDPWLLDPAPARAAPDPVLAEFARGVPDEFRICDLRAFAQGKGFAWGRNGPKTAVRRHAGGELLFAVEKKRGRLKRVLSPWLHLP